jgi:hypothetical protein
MSKYCDFKLERILGINVNVYVCRSCDGQISVRSVFPPVRECAAKRSCLAIPDEMQQYVSYALRWPKLMQAQVPGPSGKLDDNLLFFRLKNNRVLQVPVAAMTTDYTEYLYQSL